MIKKCIKMEENNLNETETGPRRIASFSFAF
jgi:hypothetical protein